MVDATDKERFREATDRLKSTVGVTMQEVGDAFGIANNTVSRWRNPGDPLVPREGWRAVLAELAEKGASRMQEGAEAGRALAKELRGK